MKTLVRDDHLDFTTKYDQIYHPNGTVERYVRGLEYDLLFVVLKELNMTIFHVPTSDGFEKENVI